MRFCESCGFVRINPLLPNQVIVYDGHELLPERLLASLERNDVLSFRFESRYGDTQHWKTPALYKLQFKIRPKREFVDLSEARKVTQDDDDQPQRKDLQYNPNLFTWC